jgi:molybdate transport system substrate-binding protein
MAGKGHFQALPEGSYPPIEQGLVVTGVGARQPLASQFAAFMRSPQAREILRKFGFSTPEREHP